MAEPSANCLSSSNFFFAAAIAVCFTSSIFASFAASASALFRSAVTSCMAVVTLPYASWTSRGKKLRSNALLVLGKIKSRQSFFLLRPCVCSYPDLDHRVQNTSKSRLPSRIFSMLMTSVCSAWSDAGKGMHRSSSASSLCLSCRSCR